MHELTEGRIVRLRTDAQSLGSNTNITPLDIITLFFQLTLVFNCDIKFILSCLVPSLSHDILARFLHH